ncbi:MAG: hypothetical protein HXY50_09660 [Ignavibacteriaceae bacterium]|nr:hypothetical protein [Ignavibacteriaceae bacterium]
MKKIILPLILLILLSNLSCSVLQTITNISRLKFKLRDVSGFTLSGITVSNKSKLSDFTALDLLKLSSSFAQGTLPAAFILNVEALNPNDGTGGYKSTDATLKSFPWRLLLDGKETISGNINQPVTVPGTGELSVIPLQINIDLVSFFKDSGYESLINLALNLGGRSGSTSKIALYAKPVVATVLGDLSYPSEIKIVDFEYSN